MFDPYYQEEINEIRRRVKEAVGGHRIDTVDGRIAVRHAINQMFREGLLSCPPEWNSSYDVTVKIAPDIREARVSISFNFEPE